MRPEERYPSLMEIYHRLYRRFGPQHWWPGDDRFEMVLGAILTQSAAWANVEKALGNLKEAGPLTPESVASIPEERLARLIYPSGYYNAKARKIKAFVQHLGTCYDFDLDAMLDKDTLALREELLSIHGIGEETADSILLYAAERPVFVIDAYTRRIMSRIGRVPVGDSYGNYQKLFEEGLPPDPRLFNEYHALLVALGKEICKKRPLCSRCCLNSLCEYGRRELDEE